MGTTSNQQPWAEEHTLAIIREIIAATLASRPNFYASPELQEVSNNRGDRINKKIQQVLKGFASGAGADGMVAEELAKIGRGKKGGGEKTEGVKKSPSKKRKVKSEFEDEEEDEA